VLELAFPAVRAKVCESLCLFLEAFHRELHGSGTSADQQLDMVKLKLCVG
jgi:hypothetical protein